jgi:hypothetical protein
MHGQPTAAEKSICTSDALSLCSAEQLAAAAIGDRHSIYECFRQHRREIGAECDRVLRKYGH